MTAIHGQLRDRVRVLEHVADGTRYVVLPPRPARRAQSPPRSGLRCRGCGSEYQAQVTDRQMPIG